MSSRLQLAVHNLSLGRRHLVNAYEVKAGICVTATTPCLSALSVRYYKKSALHLPLHLPLSSSDFC